MLGHPTNTYDLVEAALRDIRDVKPRRMFKLDEIVEKIHDIGVEVSDDDRKQIIAFMDFRKGTVRAALTGHCWRFGDGRPLRSRSLGQ